MNTKNYCIILAGGKGKRLWPSSRDNKPKQFIDFFGVGRTQLQATYDRFVKIMPKDNILITTNQEYAAMVKEQLPDLPDDNIVIETSADQVRLELEKWSISSNETATENAKAEAKKAQEAKAKAKAAKKAEKANKE